MNILGVGPPLILPELSIVGTITLEAGTSSSKAKNADMKQRGRRHVAAQMSAVLNSALS